MIPTEEINQEICALDEISEVKFSEEDPDHGKPAVLTAIPVDDVSEEQLIEVGVRIREILSRVLSTHIKGSIEHPVRVTDEGVPEAIEEKHLLKFRWTRTLSKSLSTTRLNGRKLPQGLPESDYQSD